MDTNIQAEVGAVFSKDMENIAKKAATTGSFIASVDIHTGLGTDDVEEDLIFGLVEIAEESPAGTGNGVCSTTVAVYTSAHGSGLGTHRSRPAEVRDVFMNDEIAQSITDDSTEALTCIAVQNFGFTQRVEDNYFIGEISFDVYCYGSE